MIKKACALGLLIILSGIQAGADDKRDTDIFVKFIVKYTSPVYLRHPQAVHTGDSRSLIEDSTLVSQILGYSLGNLLQYAPRGSENHRIWLMLERKTKDMIFLKIEKQGEENGWDRAVTEDRKKKAWLQCLAAQQGWLNDFLAPYTQVQPESAPNFFNTLAITDAEDLMIGIMTSPRETESRLAGGEYTCEIKEYRDPRNPNRAGWLLKEEIGKHLIVHVGNVDDQYRALFIRLYGETRWNSAGALQEMRLSIQRDGRFVSDWQVALDSAQTACREWGDKNDLNRLETQDRPAIVYTCDIQEYRDPQNPDRGGWFVEEVRGGRLTIHIGHDESKHREVYIRVFGEASWDALGPLRWVRAGNWRETIYEAERKCSDWRKRNQHVREKEIFETRPDPEGGEYTCEIKESRDPRNPDRGGWIVYEWIVSGNSGNRLIIHVGNNDDQQRAVYIRVYGEEAWNRLTIGQALRVEGNWLDALNYAQKKCQDWLKKNEARRFS